MIKQQKEVIIIGAGLAGCEAARQLSKRGVKSVLFDIKPQRMTPAHSNPCFAELVCSNSLKSEDVLTASGLLKAEMRIMDSLVLSAAEGCRVAAGTALAVDRDLFSEKITEIIKNDANITIKCGEVSVFDKDAVYIVAAGPLCTPALLSEISRLCGSGNLSFYDAAAPIVTEESIDFESAFRGARYGKGGDDYINCPMDKQQYLSFLNALITADIVKLKDFEDGSVFEGCMPVEVLAKRGGDAIRFGPLKPVGLTCPDGTKPYAAVQLRREKAAGEIFNIVGFQTNLTFKAQKQVFSLIPALKNAEFVRYGVMHRNSFLNAPKVLDGCGRLKAAPNIFIAGQLSGVEGYMESAVSGIMAGINAAGLVLGRPLITLSADTMTGALFNYLTNASEKHFQPMNANFGILNPLAVANKKARYQAFYDRAINEITRAFPVVI